MWVQQMPPTPVRGVTVKGPQNPPLGPFLAHPGHRLWPTQVWSLTSLVPVEDEGLWWQSLSSTNRTFILSASALEKSVVCQGNSLHWRLSHSLGKSQDA